MKTRVVIAMTVAFLHLPAATAAQEADPSAPSGDPGSSDVIVEVAGLTCPFCAYGLEKKFVEAPEVDSVSVGLEEGEVRLWLVPDGEMADDAVRKVVRDAGFTPGEIRRPQPPRGRRNDAADSAT